MKRVAVAAAFLLSACDAPEASEPVQPPTICRAVSSWTYNALLDNIPEASQSGFEQADFDRAIRYEVSAVHDYKVCWEETARDAIALGATKETAVEIADVQCVSFLDIARRFHERADNIAGRLRLPPPEQPEDNWIEEQIQHLPLRADAFILCRQAGHLH